MSSRVFVFAGLLTASFHTSLRVEALDDSNWKLLDGLVYDSDIPCVGRVVVPAGYVTDFSSVPRVPLAFLLFGGRANIAGTLHDWLYTTGLFPKRVCDAVFYEAMRATGVRWDRAWWMWLGVALGGRRAWRKCRADVNPDLFGVQLMRSKR